LPGLLKQIGPIDIFLHDSLHTAENTLFEMRTAWPALRPGGAIVVDDIDSNEGFRLFCGTVPHHRAWACDAEPIRPDGHRASGRGTFGIIIKAL
jgi:hypothetical protein